MDSIEEVEDRKFDGACLRMYSLSNLRRCSFKKADLSEANMQEFPRPAVFGQCDFTEANLTLVRLDGSDLTGSTFRGAKLTNAILIGAILANADLTNADLTGANLADADLRGARIDGADFKNANLFGANFAGVDRKKAKNLSSTSTPTAKVGPKTRELTEFAKSAEELSIHAEVEINGERIELYVYSNGNSARPTYQPRKGWRVSFPVPTGTFDASLSRLANTWSHGTLMIDTITAKGKKCKLRGKALLELAVAAWCEVFGVESSHGDALTQRQQGRQRLHEEMLADLDSGAEGIKRWNARDSEDRDRGGSFRRLDFSNKVLDGAHFGELDFEGSIFDGAKLKECRFHGNLKQSSFRSADCTMSNFGHSKCSDASFEGTKLSGSRMLWANFQRANFRLADLANANFTEADLRGADFTDADLESALFDRAKYDEETRWPKGFVLPEELRWSGKGPDPRTQSKTRSKKGPIDFESFMKRLTAATYVDRLSKALKMLKAERFQLFSEVKPDSLLGIVKSQTDKELVYSCRLVADGQFSCCTQNLKPCGGLRGALCKHLLVLIIGLAKAGEIDAATVDNWVNASRTKKPALDKDVMSETFLRYKGAEAGEVDWRPTETIPEDYYTL